MNLNKKKAAAVIARNVAITASLFLIGFLLVGMGGNILIPLYSSADYFLTEPDQGISSEENPATSASSPSSGAAGGEGQVTASGMEYPDYGEVYATLELPALGLTLDVTFGDDLKLIKNNVGQFTGSYMPGEGGTILYAGHNARKIFGRLGELQPGDEVIVTPNYGTFTYQVALGEVVDIVDQPSINREREELIMYTCYPFNAAGLPRTRYLVHCDLVETLSGGQEG